MDLRQRCLQAEVMDQPNLDPALHMSALDGLARLNRVSDSAGILWTPLAELCRRIDQPLRILDLATGAGDVPVRLWQRARRNGRALTIDGCDRSAVAVAHARARAERAGASVGFFQHDALMRPLPAGFDAIVCSLFLHHLSDGAAVDLLRRMAAAATHLVLVNDLARSTAGMMLARVATRLLTGSAVVHTDGPRSVAAAFTVAEARALAQRAGLDGAIVARRWPCRWLLTWERP